jgi:ATP-binding cassette subfamily B protein
MGFFSSLNNEKYDRQYSDRMLVGRIATYFKPQTTRLTVLVSLVMVVSVLGAAQPVIVSKGVDLLKSQPDMNAILLVSGAVFLIGLANWLLNWARRSLLARSVGDVVMDVRTQAFSAATAHDLSFYDKYSSGRIVSRITSDTNEFGQLVSIITDVGSQITRAVLLGVVLARTETRLSLILFSFMPFLFLLAFGYRRIARNVTRRGMQAMADVNSAIKETVSGISIAKNFRQEQSVFETFDKANQTSYRVNVRRGFVLSLVFPTLNALGGIFTAILVYFGGLSVSQGLVTAGAWYLFIMSLDNFMFPVMSLSAFWAQIQSGLSSAERVFALIDADPNVVQTAQNEVLRLKGEIEFDRLEFRYADNEPILTDFSLRVKPGETLAIVGHTGAGKSSLAKLIARFYEFQGGSLRLDGLDIRSFDLAAYRRQLGIVSQVPFLFSGTVAENIRYAVPGATEVEMLTLAKRIGEGEWLETLPDGLESQVNGAAPAGGTDAGAGAEAGHLHPG